MAFSPGVVIPMRAGELRLAKSSSPGETFRLCTGSHRLSDPNLLTIMYFGKGDFQPRHIFLQFDEPAYLRSATQFDNHLTIP